MGSRQPIGRTRFVMQIALGCMVGALLLATVAPAEESLAERRERIQAMSAAEREDLSRHAEQFRALDPEEQRQIRHLYQQVQQDPDGEKLRETMNRYCRWLATLPPYRRAELLELEPAARIKQIKQILQEQAKTAATRLGTKDREAVAAWMEKYATDHEARTMELPDARRYQAAKVTPAMRHRIVMALLCQRWQSANLALHPPIAEPELTDLRARLSAEARGRLEARPAAEQPRMLAAWLRQVAYQQTMARRAGSLPALGFDDQLADFFEFQLKDEERDRLMSLPGAEMQQKLREMYLTQTKPAEPPRRAKKPSTAAAKPKKSAKPAEKTTQPTTPAEKRADVL